MKPFEVVWLGFTLCWMFDLRRINACPESFTCVCEFLTRSVTCSRTPSLSTRLPKGIPANTDSLTVTLSTLMKIGPTAFRSIRSVADIDLNSNKIETISETSFQNLPRLQSLNLDDNRLKLIPERAFSRSSKLRKLSLSGNRILVLIPLNFARLHSLEELYLLRNPTMCIALDAFAGLSKLRRLEMSEMNTTLDSSLLSDLHELRNLTLRGFGRVKTIPHDLFKNNAKLEKVYLENIRLSGGINSGLLRPLKNLKVLSLSGCSLACIPNNTLNPVKSTLMELDMSHNLLKRVTQQDFQGMTRLTTLNLRNTGLSQIPEGALSMPSLVTLDVFGNKLKTLQRNVFGEGKISLRNVFLGNNPWICDCQMLWIVQEKLLHSKESPVVCTEPAATQGCDIRYIHRCKRREEYFKCQAPKMMKFGLLPKGEASLGLGERTERVSFDANCEVVGYPIPKTKWILKTHTNSQDRNRRDLRQKSSYSRHLTDAFASVFRNKRDADGSFCSICEASSKHTTENIWISPNGTLHVRDLSVNSAVGTYTCVSINNYGSIQKSLVVNVADGYELPSPRFVFGSHNGGERDVSTGYFISENEGKMSSHRNSQTNSNNFYLHDGGDNKNTPILIRDEEKVDGKNGPEDLEKFCKPIECYNAYGNAGKTAGLQRDGEGNNPYLMDPGNYNAEAFPNSQTSVCCAAAMFGIDNYLICLLITLDVVWYSTVV